MATNTEDYLSLNHFRSIPFGLLRPSAVVDFVLFFASQKPAIRLLVSSETSAEALGIWCSKTGYDFATDQDGFSCIATSPGYAEAVLKIDQRLDAHEAELGSALGYPDCCCERLASIGESNIDAYASNVAGWTFVNEFRRINPTQYLNGLSLISHLPCSPNCEASLVIAKQARRFVLTHTTEPILRALLRSSLVR